MRVLRPTDVTVPDDVFRQLSSATSGGLVCPQLQHLAWTSSYGWEHMRRFFSPYLISVLLLQQGKMQPNTELALACTISLLPTECLEELDLDIPGQPSALIHSALSDTVRRLSPHFKRLTTRYSLSEAAWAHLASLPKLGSFGVSGTPPTGISKSVSNENAFPALECMKIEVDNARQHWSSLFSLLGSSPLQEVCIMARRRIPGVDVPGQVTIAALKAELQQSVDGLLFYGFDPANITFLSHLRPFRSLKSLKCVTWCRWPGQCVSPLTDLDIEQLSSGLPQLATLWLGHECNYAPHNTTIKSMISLSTHCLSLGTLCLPCNLANISEDVNTESGEPDPRLKIRSPCVLRFIAFRWITMPLPDDLGTLKIVASAFHHLFPLLWPRYEIAGPAWKTTLDMIKDFGRGNLDTADAM